MQTFWHLIKNMPFKINQAGSKLGLTANKGMTLKELLHKRESLCIWFFNKAMKQQCKRYRKKQHTFCILFIHPVQTGTSFTQKQLFKIIFLHNKIDCCNITCIHHMISETNSNNFQFYGNNLNEIKCNQLYM